MAAADNDDKILAENGIFQAQDGECFVNGLTCLICKKDTMVDDYRKHIKNPSHIGTLQRFAHAFERRDSIVGCKICGKELEWRMVKDHAFWHTVPPWYEPADRYKKFFANQMLELETLFFCHICDVIFPEWSTAFAHITEDGHKASVEAVQETSNDSASYSTVETLCELLVSEGFIFGSSTEVVCKICSCLDVTLTNIFTHIRGSPHAESKQRFVSALKERYLTETIEKPATEHSRDATTRDEQNQLAVERAESTDDSTPGVENLPTNSSSPDGTLPSDASPTRDKLPCIYMVSQTDTDCYCKLCNMKLIGQTSIDNHFTSESHTSALTEHGCNKISPRDGGYYCECCNWYTCSLEDVHSHVKEPRHIRALSDKRETLTIDEIPVETPKSPDNASYPARLSLSSNYIEILNSVDFCCKICKVVLSNHVLIDEHVAGQLHKSTVSRYGLDSRIKLIDGNRYRCECCDYIIPNVEDVAQHTISTAHKSFLNSSIKQEPPPSAAITLKTNLPEQPASTLPTLSSYFMVKLNETDVFCRLCNIVLYGQLRFSDHLLGVQHEASVKRHNCHKIVLNEADSYYCEACKLKIYNPEQMLLHIKGYAHMKTLGKADNHGFAVKGEPQAVLLNGPRTTGHSSSDDSSANLSNANFSSEARPPPLVQPTVKNSIAAKPNEIVLSQYGCESYVTSMANGKYHCNVCNCEIPKPENIYGHITGTRHKSNAVNPVKNVYQRAEASPWRSPCPYIVKSSDADFRCQVCDQTLSGQAVADHAAGDQHAASLKRYGCQNILRKDEIDYYCQSCRCKIPGLANVFLHMKGSKHRGSLSGPTNVKNNQYHPGSNRPPMTIKTQQQVLQNSSQTACQKIQYESGEKSNDSSSKVQTSVVPQVSALHEYTGDSHIKPLGGNKYQCECCDCIIPSFDNIYVHTTGNRHRSFVKDSTDSRFQPSSYNHSSHCRYIARLSETHFRCNICDLTLSDPAAVEKHATGEQHAAALQRYGCKNIVSKDGSAYYCLSCRCRIPSLPNVYLHVKGPRHANFLAQNVRERAVPEVSKTNVDPITANRPSVLANATVISRQSEPLNYVMQLSVRDFRCKICDLSLIGQESVDDHVASEMHANARARYRCDDISPLERGKHYCGCCNCELPNLDGVYRHIRGIRHSEHVSSDNGIAAERSRVVTPLDEGNTQRKLEQNKTVSSPVGRLVTVADDPALVRTNNTDRMFDNSAIERHEKTISTRQVSCVASGASAVKQHSETTSNSDKKSDNSDLVMAWFERMKKILNGKVNDFSVRMETNSQSSSVTLVETVERRYSNLGDESFVSEDCDRADVASPESSQFTSKRNANSGRKPRAPRKTNVQKVTETFDFDNDHIHDMKDKLKEINLGLRLSIEIDSNNVYCLVCRTDIEVQSEDYAKHLSSLEHCENFEEMKKDHALFEIVPGQFSDFDLALQYMEEMSDDRIRCFVCHEEIENVDCAVQNHIADVMHVRKCREIQTSGSVKHAEILLGAQCDWYNIHKYRCEPCSANFQSEFSFAKHLNCTGHGSLTKKVADDGRQMMYDFCSSCSLLWYGYQSTYARHCDTPTHKWITRDGNCFSPDLPKSAQLLLTVAEEYAEDTIGYLEDVLERERRKEKTLMSDVEKAVKLPFPQAKIYTFGSRAAGTSTPDSGIDLFLDYGNMYNGSESSKHPTMDFITSVNLCLSKDTQSWETVQLSTNMKANMSVIKAQHRATGLSCNMSFDNGLGVENTKLIKLMNDAFPECRKMILFLKQWLAFCDLSGSEGISSYAISWHVIFALQRQSFLPSIARLIEIEGKSHVIAGWEVGVSRQLNHDPELRSPSFKKLLVRFFDYYASFDYRYDVACPLLGNVMKKRTFVNPQNSPEKMEAYAAHMRNSDDPEPFRIDSYMCIQDPFDLQRNLTKDVSKVCLSRFRIYCAKSRDLLLES